MSGGDAGRHQRAVMATNEGWERVSRRAAASGMEFSRFPVHRALAAEVLPSEVLRRAVREQLTMSLLEERRQRFRPDEAVRGVAVARQEPGERRHRRHGTKRLLGIPTFEDTFAWRKRLQATARVRRDVHRSERALRREFTRASLEVILKNTPGIRTP